MNARKTVRTCTLPVLRDNLMTRMTDTQSLFAIGKTLVCTALFLIPVACFGQISIRIDADAASREVSPYLYARNNSFSSTNPNWALPAEDLIRYRDAGVMFFRESGGNNSTKYNWHRKLSSHPDWYNNVYYTNWDQAAQSLQKNFPNAQGMWSFQLLGYAAKTVEANFGDWAYNGSQWWEGVNQNLAGNGEVNSTGQKAKREGDFSLYLEKWTADSTTGILKHWFGNGGLGLNKQQIRYWNMDNEPEIWSGTHDDVMPVQITPQEFIKKYIEVAKKARLQFPDIKLVGPVTANEWQWYNWNGEVITENGKHYPWLEYFIKEIAAEQKRSGVGLLDVLDIHFYPFTKKTEEVVQLHRVFFDRTFNFPEANGVKKINGSYDNSITKEFIFGRCNDWLSLYLGADHGVTLGLTETGIDDSIEPTVTAVWYASMLGEFMKNQVEIFTPWSWKPGMWETLHLFSRYNKNRSIDAISSNETLVSAYPTMNTFKDSLTVVLVNRSPGQSQTIQINLENFIPIQEEAFLYTLSQLPSTETFHSKTENALKTSKISPFGNLLNLSLPAMSVSSVVLRGGGKILSNEANVEAGLEIYPNPSWDTVFVKWETQEFYKMEILDQNGKTVFQQSIQKAARSVEINPGLTAGVHMVKLIGRHKTIVKKIIAR